MTLSSAHPSQPPQFGTFAVENCMATNLIQDTYNQHVTTIRAAFYRAIFGVSTGHVGARLDLGGRVGVG
jgi:hypothetical protein